jgi:hypothetical protein
VPSAEAWAAAETSGAGKDGVGARNPGAASFGYTATESTFVGGKPASRDSPVLVAASDWTAKVTVSASMSAFGKCGRSTKRLSDGSLALAASHRRPFERRSAANGEPCIVCPNCRHTAKRMTARAPQEGLTTIVAVNTKSDRAGCRCRSHPCSGRACRPSRSISAPCLFTDRPSPGDGLPWITCITALCGCRLPYAARLRC